MTNITISRRQALIAYAGLGFVALTKGTHAFAQSQPQLIYGDGLQPGWRLEGWSEQKADFAFDGQKVIQINMKAWNATIFGSNTPIPVSQFSTLTLLLHGGDKGHQELKVRLRLGEEVISKDLTLKAFKNTWTRIDCDLKKFKAKNDSFDNIMIVNPFNETQPEFYINYVILQ